MSDKTLLITVLGPTAVGKTAISTQLASLLGTHIISADSRQFYANMPIGTACPSDHELALAPHHFISFLQPEESYSAGRFEQEALALLPTLFKDHRIVVMSGGSGLYAEAVCEGLDALPSDKQLRQNLINRFHNHGLENLLEELLQLDPDHYSRIDRKNPHRVIRALEVCILSGKPYSSLRKALPVGRNFDCLKFALGMSRELLYDRINQRVDAMMDAGLLEEAKRLLAYRTCNSLNTVGYKELFDYFDGLCSLEKAVEDIKQNTRRYAKRQITWLRRMADVHWIDAEYPELAVEQIMSISANKYPSLFSNSSSGER
jgi:tRNA dimethylallyltransferase